MTRPFVTEEELHGPPSARQRLELLLAASGVLGAALPTTSFPPMALTALRYRRFRDEERFQRMHKMLEWADFCTRHILRATVRVEGRVRLPEERTGLMYICNHQSYVDIPIIMGSLRIGAFLSKSLVAYLPVIGQIAWLGGTIYLDRRSPDSRRRALEETLRMCAESTPVVVFPEGARSRDGNLRTAIQPGALHAAWERGLRVCALAVHGTRYVFPPTMDRVFFNQPVAVTVGETFHPERFSSAEAFAKTAWQAVEGCFVRAQTVRRSMTATGREGRTVWPDRTGGSAVGANASSDEGEDRALFDRSVTQQTPPTAPPGDGRSSRSAF